MLHGVYGRGRNWQAIAKELSARRPDWGSLLMDLRLHGQSVGDAFEPPHTLARAAEDVQETAAVVAQRDGTAIGAVLGHSFGGKVALALAGKITGMSHVWVIDSTPEVRAPAGSAWNMLEHVHALPSTFATRGDAVAGLEARGWPTGVATWMATNLRFEDGQYRWMLDFEAMEALLRSFFETDLWPVVEQPPGQIEIHFVKAEESHTLSEEACAQIQRAHDANGRVHLHRVAGGHWLNADNPQAIIALLVEHLPAAGSRDTAGG
jgi:esterase